MKDSKKNFEDYLRHIINDTRFDDFISEILDSFSLIELKKNDFLEISLRIQFQNNPF